MDLAAFIARWTESGAAERANKDQFLLELCDLIEVPRPNPTTGDSANDLYVFERDAILVAEGQKRSVGKIDLYKDGCFLLEAKQGSEKGSPKLGTAKRNTPAWNVAMRDALGQALGYARTLDRPPPFLVTCDIGHCFDLYASFDGTADYAFGSDDGYVLGVLSSDLHRAWALAAGGSLVQILLERRPTTAPPNG